jgi:hypothetical protein
MKPANNDSISSTPIAANVHGPHTRKNKYFLLVCERIKLMCILWVFEVVLAKWRRLAVAPCLPYVVFF